MKQFPVTFGIVYGPGLKSSDVHAFCSLIQCQGIDEYEILLVGDKSSILNRFLANELPVYDHLRYIDFDETQKPKAWITKKKNLITELATYDTIVYMHDYLRLDPLWYQGYQFFEEDFDVVMNPVLINDSASGHDDFTYRHSDWVIDPFLLWELYPELHWKYWDVALPYETRGLTKLQYISGGYWVAKKKFMEQHPLNEDLLWGDAEDIEWSKRIRQVTEFKFNPDSYVWVRKPGKWKPGIIPDVYLNALKKHHGIE